ncbi:GspH/FimT family pseudopilin [Undibacterium terreum]|uniref:Type II secretion system protein H n=1 Tax=Undibacterium terreum TaxID=1224302 RepID=A0A916UFN0_9BURK|nr:GspH/FimT family pseudopilin [Undibacterium terreum]GGC71216.1 hypothetical protein GCM10011396_17960 [Undibacterium terreum]
MLKNELSAFEKGFTMVELVIGIAIVAIVMAIGMPSYGTWILNSKLRGAAESIQSGLQVARAEAVRRNAAVKFTLGSGSSWTVGCVTVSATCPAVLQSRATGDGSSAAVTVNAVDGTPITFDSFGRMTAPTPSAGTATQINVDIDPAVLPANKTRDLRINIGVSGNIKMCDPDPSVVSPDPRAC